MSTIEKLYVHVLFISIISLIFMISYFIFDLYNYIDVSALFIMMFFYSLPFIIFKRKVRNNMDEMAKEINRRSTLISLQITWVFIAFSIAGMAMSNAEYIKIIYVEFMLFAGVWLILTVRAISTLYFYKRGINK